MTDGGSGTAERRHVGKGFTPFLRAMLSPSIAQVSPEKWLWTGYTCSMPGLGGARIRLVEKPLSAVACQVMQEGCKTLPYIISHRESEAGNLCTTGN